ncbi:MAG TPA: type IV pilus twitching motility protein PilT [Anaeromyxobacteraceae bacterium]|nr:type IV pilus twitching motility protein PilT [Anaeromyxobacteraceae bacterium]
MARIDPFIERLVAEQADRLEMSAGQGAMIHGPRGPQPLIRQPLTAAQIAGALAEIVPEELRAGFPRPGRTSFAYDGPHGAVEVRVEATGGSIRATIVPVAKPGAVDLAPAPDVFPGGAPGARRPAATPPPAPPAPRPPATPARAAAGRQGAVPNPPEPRLAIDALLAAMLERRASDLHLSSDSPPMFRIDGDMAEVEDYGPVQGERLKELIWAIAPEKNREEWHARKDTDFAHEIPAARFRVNVFADRKGIGAVLRQIPNDILTAEKMGLSQAILDLCWLTKGLVLVTGPTGSGKSTTLAAMIDYINRNRSDHIITIEDPIEFVHPNKRCLVNQREVGVHTGSFKAALRAALREDPDVVLVGELRDLETIAIAIETAETGHLVFGTLHTNTAPSTVDRIIDQFPADRQAQIRMMLSESLKGVISQTLCKRIGGGRVPAQEVLLVPSSVANLIREGKTFQIPSMMQTGRASGMATLNDALIDLVKKKVVEPKEAWMKAVAKAEFKALLERANVHVDLEG